mgnify:FL=1|jgi:hypothetical protein
MSKQLVNIVEFPKLYNILNEIKNLFIFNIHNYEDSKDFIKKIELNNIECVNSTVIVESKNHLLFSSTKINKSNILVLNELPMKIEKILDEINAQLIKQKYNFQSKINIRDYILNINARTISINNIELKLTEREIDIILFLNENKKPQSINDLQNDVWDYGLDLETHTVETHIYRLRKKIKDKFNDENFIISHEQGYKI